MIVGERVIFLWDRISNGLFATWQVSHLQLSSRVHSLCGLLEGGFPESAEFSSTNPLKRSDLWENPAMFVSGSQAQKVQCTKIGVIQIAKVFCQFCRYFTFTIDFCCGRNISQKLYRCPYLIHLRKHNIVIKKMHRTSLFLLSAMWFSPPNGLMFGAKISRPAGILYLEKTCGCIHRHHLPLCSFRVEAWRKHRDIMLMMTIFLN